MHRQNAIARCACRGNSLAFVEHLPRRHGRPRVLVAERDVVVNKVANCLDLCPTRRRFLEQLPCDIGKPIGLAIAAAEQIDDGPAGKSLIACWVAEGMIMSGRPLSRTTPSAERRMRPAGATSRLHQFPKLSR